MEYVIVFVAAAALIFLGWCLLGLLLSPVFEEDMVTFCFVRGDGAFMEQRVRAYGWLREGKVRGGRLVLVDCGLSPQGLETAQVLRSRFDWVEYCPRPALEDYIDLLER